jgi:hypothetical protein
LIKTEYGAALLVATLFHGRVRVATLLKKNITLNNPQTPKKIILHKTPHKKFGVTIKRVWKEDSKNVKKQNKTIYDLLHGRTLY